MDVKIKNLINKEMQEGIWLLTVGVDKMAEIVPLPVTKDGEWSKLLLHLSPIMFLLLIGLH